MILIRILLIYTIFFLFLLNNCTPLKLKEESIIRNNKYLAKIMNVRAQCKMEQKIVRLLKCSGERFINCSATKSRKTTNFESA